MFVVIVTGFMQKVRPAPVIAVFFRTRREPGAARFSVGECMTEAAFFVPDLPPGIPHRRELVVRRSRFIASAGHTPGNEAVRLFIGKCREDFPDARHHCFAFNAGRGDSTAFLGSSDDGEPRGTAGRPMLNLLTHSGIGEITVVVSRYFGGTLLGTGGLVRAYQDSVREALRELPLKKFAPGIRYRISAGAAVLNAVLLLIRRSGGVPEMAFPDERAVLTFSLPAGNAAEFEKELPGIRDTLILERQPF